MFWIVGILVALLVLHLLAIWAEKKGWIYYRQGGGRGTGAALSNALAEFDAVINPAAEHRLEEERTQQIIASESGSGRLVDDPSGTESPIAETEAETGDESTTP